MLAYPVVGRLWYFHYPVLGSDSAMIFGLIFGLGFITALILTASRQWFVHVIFVLTGSLALLLKFNLLIKGSILVVIGLTLFAWLSKTKFPTACLVIFTALFLGSALDARINQSANLSEQSTRVNQADLPAVVHIILDAFMGLDGLPDTEAVPGLGIVAELVVLVALCFAGSLHSLIVRFPYLDLRIFS